MSMSGSGLILAVGGGVVSDIVGYAASIYRRGVAHIRIPTTLLAQVDAAVGVKNGINYSINNKNFLGSFYTAKKVVICDEFLKTLPNKIGRSGVAEMIKLAIIADKKLFNLILAKKEELSDLKNNWDDIYVRGIKRRAIIGMEKGLVNNFFEHDTRRAVAFGHEIAHLLEGQSNFTISHGEAVAINVAFSCAMSYMLKNISEQDLKEILDILLFFNLPIFSSYLKGLSLPVFLSAIRAQRRGHLHYVIPKKIGSAAFLEDIEERLMVDACIYLDRYANAH